MNLSEDMIMKKLEECSKWHSLVTLINRGGICVFLLTGLAYLVGIRKPLFFVLFYGSLIVIAAGILISEFLVKGGINSLRKKGLNEERLQYYLNETKAFRQKSTDAEENKALKGKFPYNAALVKSGELFNKEIKKANDLIHDKAITNNLNTMSAAVSDIFKLASQNKANEKKIRKFSNHYLPMTIKLLNKYIELDSRKVQSEDVKFMKQKLSETIEEATGAFVTLNKNLFEESSVDISTDIELLKTLLNSDYMTKNKDFNIWKK